MVPTLRAPSVLAAAALGALLGGSLAAPATAAPGYLRYPDLHGDTVVFCAEGDLWTAPVTGGTAHHLTAHAGTEYFPRFSPDGTRIAFTAEYDGNRDVFLIPASGGEPRRLTWDPSADEVIGWTPDGKEILFRSRRDTPHGDWAVYAIGTEGADPRMLPVGRTSRLAIDPQSGLWALNRTDRERSTWKRYRGGTAADIWVGHPDRKDFRRITTFAGHDMIPMWWGGRIYWACDEGGTQEIWSMNPDGSARTRLTDHGNWDIRYPEMGDGGRIVYMVAGDIGLYDIASGTDTRLAIDVPGERTLTRVRYPDPDKYLTEFALSPDGERVAVVARGEIFSVPVKKGVTLAVTSGSGARERGIGFDPDGKNLYFITDAPGEEELRVIDAWGRGEARPVKRAGEKGWHFPPAASPDGKRIAWADQTHTLWVQTVPAGSPVRVDRSEQAEIREYVWSPDGRYLAYTKSPRTEFFSIFVWDSKDASVHRITGDETIDYSPAWDPDGRWLAFLSDRIIDPVLDTTRDFQNVDVLTTKPYLVMLKADAPSPFEDRGGLPEDDAAAKGKDAKKKDAKGKKDDKGDKDDDAKKKPEPIEIAWDGIRSRVVEVPVDAGILGGLGASASHLFWFANEVHGISGSDDEDGGGGADLVSFDLEKKKDKVFASGVTAYDLRPDAGKIAFQKERGEIYVAEIGGEAPDDLSDAAVSLQDVVIDLDPREEWRQMYFEGWRNMRDFVWVESMAGLDWKAMRDQYATLLPRLAIRDDLRDLIGELIGELATSHTYVYGGDYTGDPKGVPTGLLGGRFVREGAAYRVEKIYRGDPADLDRSPLEEPGVNVREGDYILAVNHRPLPADRPLEAAFENLAGRPVVLRVASNAAGKDARDVLVTPLRGDSRLRYIDWVRSNREAVAKATDGKIAYIHIPDMGSSGLREFNRWFYPQLDRSGMIVDCRWNGGGFVSQMLLERFRRGIVSWDRSRGGGVFSYPWRALNGPFVVLTNEQAGSDGDIFPYAVQYEGMAPVIGERSWGGVVGIRGDKPLVDGGQLTQPEFAWWDPKRGWSIENHGVDPDIVVEATPQDDGAGIDRQLERGIQEVTRILAENPPQQPTFEGEIPDKSRSGFRAREGGGR